MSGELRICIVGGAGRMGGRLIRIIDETEDLLLASVLEGRAAIDGGFVAPGSHVTTDPASAVAAAEVVIDFAAPAACTRVAPACASAGVPYVVASTALTGADEQALEAAAARVAILQAANFSIGVNVAIELAELAAARLGTSFEVEMHEIHHRYKRDAPSGTALALRDAVRRGRGEVRTVLGRAGTEEPRANDELGIAASRGGDVSGEHTVFYFGESERLELTHRAGSPDIFAHGALRAARWLVGREPARYGMRDVIGGAPGA